MDREEKIETLFFIIIKELVKMTCNTNSFTKEELKIIKEDLEHNAHDAIDKINEREKLILKIMKIIEGFDES